MKIFKRLKLKRTYYEQLQKFPDKEVENLIDETFKLYPQVINISDGELRNMKGFWSESLSDAWRRAEGLNMPYSEEIDFMIWAVYGELHKKSIENFKKGIFTVSLSELNHNKISSRYIKDRLESNMY